MNRDNHEGQLATSKLLVLICTYNERGNLPTLFEQLRSVVPEADLLVVDDNSPDRTGDWVREVQTSDARVHLISRSGKLGLGTAIREGMKFAISNGFEWVVNLDADLSHDPKTILAMKDLAPSHDLVIGSRYVPGGGMKGCSWRREWVSRCANIYAKLVVGWKINDCSSAFRMYRTTVLASVDLDSIQAAGYGFLEEILGRFIGRNARIVETPIIYTERSEGKSKISVREAGSTIAALHRVAKRMRSQ